MKRGQAVVKFCSKISTTYKIAVLSKKNGSELKKEVLGDGEHDAFIVVMVNGRGNCRSGPGCSCRCPSSSRSIPKGAWLAIAFELISLVGST